MLHKSIKLILITKKNLKKLSLSLVFLSKSIYCFKLFYHICSICIPRIQL